MSCKSQMSFEYLLLAIFVILAVTLTAIYSESLIVSQRVDYTTQSIITQISDAVETVAVMGFPARLDFNVYVPGYYNESGTYVRNNTINYQILERRGVRDIFDVFDYCVKGNLPVLPGYYVINVFALDDCVVIDYNNFYINPLSVSETIRTGENVSIIFDIINLYYEELEMIITANSSTASLTDVDPNIAGRQVVNQMGNIISGGFESLEVTFFGDSEGLYEGFLYFNDIAVPVTINVSATAYSPPIITNTRVNTTSAYTNDYVCFNATITEGTESIDTVWVNLRQPGGCWSLNGECNSSCNVANLGTTNYYTNFECNETCQAAGTFYIPSGSCSSDGSGNCYFMSDSASKFTTCTQSTACESSCSGTPTSCDAHTTFCTDCGCTDSGGGGSVDWTEDFDTNTDWATWTSNGNGIAYVNDATNCVNDANDDCMNLDGGSTDYYLYKQTSIDLSTCESGAWFYIGHVKEGGTLEGNDCIYVAFSNNGGSSWSSDNLIFCNDNPSSTYNITIPDAYLTNDFRIRVRKSGFTGGGEEAWLDDFNVHCSTGSGCSGTPDDCSTHSDQTSCEDCGCSWGETSWNWTLGGITSGYDVYENCVWNSSAGTVTTIELSDTSSCSNGIGDGIYGTNYQLTSTGSYTLISGSVNDTTSYTDTDTVNTDITVTSAPSLTNTTVLFEQFTPTPYYNYNWTRLGTDWDSQTSNCYSAGGCAHADGTCDETNDYIQTITGILDLSSANNVFVDLYVREDTSFDTGDYFRVWCYDSSSWVKIYEEDTGDWVSGGTYRHREFTAHSSCFINNAQFRITIISDHQQEDIYVDDFRVVIES